ncbi:MAG: exopolysaccharide biosynthesis polyprenyl glycosylphosphotransferase [Lachnospiraceae bacterium]
MQNREYSKRVIVFAMGTILVLTYAIIFGYIWYDYYKNKIFFPFFQRGNWVLIALYILVFLLFARLYGGLRIGYLKKSDVIYSLIIATLCANVVLYLQITLINRWFLSAVPIIVMTGVQCVISVLWALSSHYIYTHLYKAHDMLVIYGPRKPEQIIRKMHSRKDKYNITGTIHIDAGEKAIYKEMKKYKAVIIWDLPAETRNEYLKYCFAHSIRCYITPKISDIIVSGADRIHLLDTPLLLSKNMGLSGEQVVLKRFIDLLISSVAIVLFSPLMLVIALIIKLYDHGPVFYRQERLTIGGKAFKIFKFRSMCCDSEEHGARLASKNDSRITPVGKVLRNLHFDELPQLFNIFLGDMSVVGPRPERKEIQKEYQRDIPEFYYRLKVKAGLTGYAQVYGKYNTLPYDKLKMDLYYIENYSVLLDLKLLFMTFKIFAQKETSEGIEDGLDNALQMKED